MNNLEKLKKYWKLLWISEEEIDEELKEIKRERKFLVNGWGDANG